MIGVDTEFKDKRNISLILLAYFFLSCIGVVAKYNALYSVVFSVRFFIILGFQVIGLTVFTIWWKYILGKYQLSYAYAFKGSITIWTLVFGKLFFDEVITINNILGSICIIVGIGVISYE